MLGGEEVPGLGRVVEKERDGAAPALVSVSQMEAPALKAPPSVLLLMAPITWGRRVGRVVQRWNEKVASSGDKSVGAEDWRFPRKLSCRPGRASGGTHTEH